MHTVCEIKDLEYEKKGKSGATLYFKGKCALTGQSCKTPLVDSATTMWNESLEFTFVPLFPFTHIHPRTLTFSLPSTECQRTRRKSLETE